MGSPARAVEARTDLGAYIRLPPNATISSLELHVDETPEAFAISSVCEECGGEKIRHHWHAAIGPGGIPLLRLSLRLPVEDGLDPELSGLNFVLRDVPPGSRVDLGTLGGTAMRSWLSLIDGGGPSTIGGYHVDGGLDASRRFSVTTDPSKGHDLWADADGDATLSPGRNIRYLGAHPKQPTLELETKHVWLGHEMSFLGPPHGPFGGPFGAGHSGPDRLGGRRRGHAEVRGHRPLGGSRRRHPRLPGRS